MPRFRVKIWTGPTTVQEIASRMREAGIADVSAGTEHVYAMVEATERGAAVHNLCVDLERKHGTSYGIGSYRHGDRVSAEAMAEQTDADPVAVGHVCNPHRCSKPWDAECQHRIGINSRCRLRVGHVGRCSATRHTADA